MGTGGVWTRKGPVAGPNASPSPILLLHTLTRAVGSRSHRGRASGLAHSFVPRTCVILQLTMALPGQNNDKDKEMPQSQGDSFHASLICVGQARHIFTFFPVLTSMTLIKSPLI